ncbi:MAG TPA: PIG-L family deacetylase [Acidimicrobiales bacterium]|nr:PIG-L family deacetylase [Acidimicrobiales bacterium]
MSTLVCFHAHPDDEAIATGGTMAKAAAAGHRVVLVVATRGEHGEVAEGFLEPDETLAQRRVVETHRAAEILGVARVEFLGYVDSGMMGTPENDLPDSFWRADVDEAAARLAAILTEEEADVLTAYDENGVYGHPDHIQVHRVGVAAGRLAATPKVYLNTVNRDFLQRETARARDEGGELPGDMDPAELAELGVGEDRITTTVDVRQFLAVKRRAMAAHASQISETSFFLAMPEDMFTVGFGQEWYILEGAPPGTRESDVFEGLGAAGTG